MLTFWCVFLSLNIGSSLSQNDNILDNDSPICKHKNCVYKCCPKDQFVEFTVDSKICADNYETFDTDNVTLYDSKDWTIPTGRKISDVFAMQVNLFSNETLLNESVLVNYYISNNIHITEHGVLYYEQPNVYERWIKINAGSWCMDYADLFYDPSEVLFFLYAEVEPTPGTSLTSRYLCFIGLIISCLSLGLVLIVYGILPELRSRIAGMIQIAYVFSLLGAYITMSVMIFPNPGLYGNTAFCITTTTIFYFFWLSAFAWMNVMSLDIWWTFRGFAKARKIHQRGENFKFRMYCLYAWGMPLAMAVAFVNINDLDLTHIPWFVTPNIPSQGCFSNAGIDIYYLYIPTVILITCDWIFYLMTVFNVWRLRRATRKVISKSSSTLRDHDQIFVVCMKMSVLMGINWILEVISYNISAFKIIWHITDTYNILVGFTIFYMLVCKKSIYYKLKDKLRGGNRVYTLSEQQINLARQKQLIYSESAV